MWQRCTCFICVVVLLALIPGAAFGAWNFLEDEALIGWWACDEGEGAVVADSSANGNDGMFVYGDPAWTAGASGSAVTLVGPTLVEVAPMNLTLAEATMAGWVLPDGPQPDWASIMMHRFGDPAIAHGLNLLSTGGLAYHWNDSSSTWSFRPAAFYSDTEWTFCAVTVAPDKATFYVNGEALDENVIAHEPSVWEGAVYLGGDGTDSWVGRRMIGSLDDVSFFSRALSADEIVDIMGGPAAAGLAAWENAVAEAAPGFLATNVEDGLYDIGAYGGEQTYEFIVQSNPLEEQASMALIGRRDFGDVQAGLKYEQWNNTGTYGATLFGVADYDYGVANDPGVTTHLVFVASTEAGTTALYVNGAYAGSVDAAITLSGLVGIGYGAQDREGADPFFDDFDGMIYGVAIYDRALSAGQIRINADAYFQKGPSDITAPGDAVQGVPNDGDWPGAETPDLAIDNDAATKFLHFKGDFDPDAGPSGIQVTPALGATVVTGLTLTTANDVPGRDPVAFALYGSNDGIDGPYTLIAEGDVVDFAGEVEWPRFTMNATPITFENDVAYTNYQLLFTAIRGPVGDSVNSMQIAEVELIGVPVIPADKPVIAWVSYHAADDEPHADAAAVGFTQAPDIEYTDLLKANGYDVVRVLTTQEPDVEYLNTFDLVIISRTASSGHYSGSGASLWNSITAPLINLNGYTLRNSRLGFTDGGTMVDTIGDITLTVADPAHPIFAGVELVDGVMVNPFAEGAVPLTTDPNIISRGISVNTDNLDEEGTVLATVATADDPTVGGIVIAELPAGATLQNSSGSPDDVLGGPRLVFLTGSREPDGVTGGQAAALYDLYADGELMFLNAVAYMLQ